MQERRALNRKLTSSAEKPKKSDKYDETKNSEGSTNAGSSKKDDDANNNFWEEDQEHY